MKTVGVFVKPTENLSEPLEHLVSVLRRAGCKVLLEERAAQALGNPDGGFPRPELGRRSDVAVVLGVMEHCLVSLDRLRIPIVR